jgi:general secretion pathway protein A
MYEHFYGLKCRPFALTPDPAFLFRSRQHSMALTLLEYGLESQAAFGLLTGDIGSGKTTLLRHLVRHAGEKVTVGLITNTHGGFRSIHPWALSAFSIAPTKNTKIAQYEALVEFLVREYAAGRRVLLIIDEAQNLSVAVLEELRLLSNVNSEQDLVLQILLVGQPELRDTLSRPELRQVAQRISVDFHLRPLDAAASSEYVRHRVRAAGGDGDLFSIDALERVFRETGGVPRLINQLCDLSLVYGYAARARRIDEEVISQVIADRVEANALSVFAAGVNADPPVQQIG